MNPTEAMEQLVAALRGPKEEEPPPVTRREAITGGLSAAAGATGLAYAVPGYLGVDRATLYVSPVNAMGEGVSALPYIPETMAVPKQSPLSAPFTELLMRMSPEDASARVMNTEVRHLFAPKGAVPRVAGPEGTFFARVGEVPSEYIVGGEGFSRRKVLADALAELPASARKNPGALGLAAIMALMTGKQVVDGATDAARYIQQQREG